MNSFKEGKSIIIFVTKSVLLVLIDNIYLALFHCREPFTEMLGRKVHKEWANMDLITCISQNYYLTVRQVCSRIKKRLEHENNRCQSYCGS